MCPTTSDRQTSGGLIGVTGEVGEVSSLRRDGLIEQQSVHSECVK